MQAYSVVKGKSRSDDGVERLPEYLVGERKTVSDDGFESFPEYNFNSKIQSYESEKSSKYFDDGTQIPPSVSISEQAISTVTEKRRRRRIIQKNKRKGPKGKAADTEEGASPQYADKEYKESGVESGDKVNLEESTNCTHEEDSLSRTSVLNSTSIGAKSRKTTKVAEDEDFGFEADEVDLTERFESMTSA